MPATGIAFTMYPVTDIPRAVAFYRDVLGLRQDGVSNEYWVEFEIGGGTFGVGNFEQVGTPGSAQSLAIEVDDLDALRGRLAQHGFAATEPHALAHCRLSVVRDPDGNQVWLHQRTAA
jgi:predicted enzyme related to lactoylglutathione lyase